MFDDKSYSLKMDKTIEVFTKELSSLRTGRANAAMLDLVKVDVYGQQMPINQLGSITTPEPRMINIQVWDQNNVSLIAVCSLLIHSAKIDENYTEKEKNIITNENKSDNIYILRNTDFPDVYELYKNNKKVGYAGVPNIGISSMIRKWYQDQDKTELRVSCIEDSFTKKIIPNELVI